VKVTKQYWRPTNMERWMP